MLNTMEKAGLLKKPKDKGFIGNTQRYLDALAGIKPGKKVSADERFSQLLAEMHEDLKAVSPQTALPPDARRALQGLAKAKTNPKKADGSTPVMEVRALGPNVQISVERDTELQALPGTDVVAHVKNLHRKHGEVKKLYAEVEQSFAETEQHLKAAKLPAEIFQRHQDALAQYNSRKVEFEHLMSKLEKATPDTQGEALAQLGKFMSNYPNAKPHQYTNPNKMPFGTPSNKVRAPLTTKEQFQAKLFPPQYETVKVASLGMNGIDIPEVKLPVLPNAADLAETDDVQITQAIKDQAAALNKNPVTIYNWVRNNIEFIPSYGSIQGSEMTLQNKRGNAFDTASLLIALYRASGIPARYVYGTIDVPADKLMNWVGGVTKVEAAQSLLGQGGIPNVGLQYGGKINSVRMEHVWVEAYVDYVPSRGAVNKVPDTWVPVDASFKQYAFSKGMDVKGNVAIDVATLLEQVGQGAVINESEGWAQNFNYENLHTQMMQYQGKVKAYIDSQKTGAKLDDVLGKQNILVSNVPILLASLPYKKVVIASAFQTLPEILQWRFKTNVYPSDGLSDASSPIIELNQPTAKLAGKKITLSFVPATQADQDVMRSYMPKSSPDGAEIPMSDLPQSLPAYLLHMKAELRVDGELIQKSSRSFTLGHEVKQSNQYFKPADGVWSGGEDNDVTIGEFNAIGIDLQGVAQQEVKKLRQKMEGTRSKFERIQSNHNDTETLYSLSKEDIVGDMTYAGILDYFSRVDSSDRIQAIQNGNMIAFRLPSYGRFYTSMQANFFFGIPRIVIFPGAEMDIDFLSQHAESKNADADTKVNFVKNTGMTSSAFEHVVPEKIFSVATDVVPAQAVSAVKVLALASAQGQKLYVLDKKNQAGHAEILQGLMISADVKNEIALALSIGKEVVVHQKNIDFFGWKGCGYIITDSFTGAGAYKIFGGGNGSKLMATAIGIGHAAITALAVNALITAGTGATAIMGVFPMLVFLTMIVVLTVIITKIVDSFFSKDSYSCYAGAFSFAFGGLVDLPKAVSFAIGIGGWQIIDAPPGMTCFDFNKT